jgi:hypothetical protein
MRTHCPSAETEVRDTPSSNPDRTFDGTSTYSESGRYRPSTPTRFKQRYRGRALLLGQ